MLKTKSKSYAAGRSGSVGRSSRSTDQKSGATEARPGLQAALQAAHERRFDLLLLWSLDRLSRGGAALKLTHLPL
ncbi:MAG: hypothetical protein E6J56_23755 [Deltaproteobacteria bacterium]|nr:MAG: hypothetical protein E6J56_23755 [Deltaproteobacteria bacterium]